MSDRPSFVASTDLQLRLEPWDVEYGGELQIDTDTAEVGEDAITNVELPEDSWRPISPMPSRLPANVIFVDGVRRAEARLIVSRSGQLCHGILGTFAVGAVVTGNSAATWGSERVERLVVIGSGGLLPGPLTLGDALVYQPASAAGTEVDAPLLVIHREMRSAEERLARELSQQSNALVIADGPLTFADVNRGQAIGFVKRLFKWYLPASLQGVLGNLAVGQRSPVFGIQNQARFGRLSWFIRLGQPLPIDGALTGLARLEVSDVVGLETALQLADATAAHLPRFAPSRSRDPRAPQNLLPIGALENHLRRRFGDMALIRRKLAALIAREYLG